MFFSNVTFPLPIRRGDLFLHTLESGRAPWFLSSVGCCGNSVATVVSEALSWPGSLCVPSFEPCASGMLFWKPSHHAARSPSHREGLTVVHSHRWAFVPVGVGRVGSPAQGRLQVTQYQAART